MRISLYSLFRDVVFIGALLFCLIYINSNVLTDTQYAILFASYSVYSLYYIWEVKKLSPFFIMMALSNVLFIGGRFWGILLNPVLTLQEGTFFDYTIISSQHMKESLYYVLIFIFFASWGYKSCRIAGDEECVTGTEYNESADVFMRRIWWVVCALAMYGQIKTFMLALSQGSYISMYIAQGQDYSAGGALGLNLEMRLRDEGDMRRPMKTVFASPALDMSLTNPEIDNYKDIDISVSFYSAKKLGEYLAGDRDPKGIFLSPLYGSHHDLGEMLMFYGGKEFLRPDCELFVEKIRETPGTQMKAYMASERYHDYLMWVNYPESVDAFEKIVAFLEN